MSQPWKNLKHHPLPILSPRLKKYLLQFKRLTFKKAVLHQLYINNDIDYHQLVLSVKYQAQVFQLIHDAQGHQGTG